MDRMAETLKMEYGVKLNTSDWNKKVTHDWDKAQSLVTSWLRSKQYKPKYNVLQIFCVLFCMMY